MSILAVPVSIVSKNEIVREGLKRILTDQGFYVDCAAFCIDDLNAENGAAIVIIDASDIDEGLRTCTDVRRRWPEPRIVIMAEGFSMDEVSRAFATGAVDGYLVKDISCDRLAGALRLTALGEKVLPSQIAALLAHTPAIAHWDSSTSGANLTIREVDILRCLVEGEANKVISRRLSIADATVKVHIKAILRKLHVRNRTQAAIWAFGQGLAGEASRQPILLPMGLLQQGFLSETSLYAEPEMQIAV
jgi:two-component system nitrate/nitrite response regulator NarL